MSYSGAHDIFSIKEGWERLGEEALTTSQSSEYTLRTIAGAADWMSTGCPREQV